MLSLLRSLIVSVALSASLSGLLKADDWPQWRGPTRDGQWRETGLIEKFSEPQITPLWQTKIGAGYSGPTVAQGRVYVTDRMGDKKPVERVLCLDAKTGTQIWSYAYDCDYTISYTAGPRACVTIDDGRAFALGAMGNLHVFDAATGELLWKRDLNQEYKIRMPIWGIAAAPLVFEELVILQIGGSDEACLVAFSKKDGKEVWRALDDRASYSAPILIEQGGAPVLLAWTGDSLSGLDPRSGKVHWSLPFKPTRMVIGIATPVVDQGRAFVTSFYDGSMMAELDPDRPAAKQLWRRIGVSERNTDALHSIIATPLLVGDHVYGVDSYGELRCLDAKTGDRLWENKTATPPARWSNIHMVENGDRVWMFNEAGELLIGRLSPGGFEEISRAKLIAPTTEQLNQRGGVCWAHPAFANRCVFIRNDREILCVSLAAE